MAVDAGAAARSRADRPVDVPFTLLGTAMVMAMGFGALFALLPDFQHELGFADWGLGAVASASFVAAFTAQLTLARYADRGHGPLMLLGGVALASAGCLAVALAQNVWMLLAARVILGVGDGMFLPAARRIVITRNRDGVGGALGRLGAMQTGGFLIGPPIAAFIAVPFGTRAPFVLLAGALIAALPAVTRMRRSIAALPAETAQAPRGALRALAGRAGVRRGILLSVGFAAAVGVYDSLWARFLKDLGASTEFVAVSLTVFAAPIALLAPRAGRLADRYGARRVGAIALIGSAPFIAAYGFLHSYWVIAAIAFLHSSFDSATNPAAQSQVARSSPDELVAAGQGLLDGVGLLAAAVSAGIAAPLYQHWGARALWVTLAVAVSACAVGAVRPLPASEDAQHVG